MVPFSNGSLSGEASNKHPMENGRVPKYKPRKVSAFREFPPGCGPNAVPKNSKPEENGCSEVVIMDAVGGVNLEMTKTVVDNGAGISEVADLIENEAVGNSEIPKAKVDEIKASEIDGECQTHEAVNGDLDVDVAKSMDAIVEEVMASINISKKMVMEIGPLRIQLPDEVGSHIHEAVDNPIEIERDQLFDSFAGNVTTTTTDGFSNEVEGLISEINLIGANKPSGIKNVSASGGQTSLQDLNKVEGLSVVQNSGVEEVKSRSDAVTSAEKELLLGNPPKDKYRPRRVSAIRDFPLHCGRHILLPVEEKQMFMSGTNSPNKTEKVEVAPEASTLRNVSERTTREVLMASQKMDELQNFPVKNGSTEPLNDGAGSRLLSEAAGVELMDFEDCNRDLQLSIIERTRASPGSANISETMIDTSIKDTGGPVGKEIAVNSPDRNNKDRHQQCDFILGDDSKREIVHGLMAARYCPWKKSKAALKNLDGGTTGQKMKQKQKPKAVALNSHLKVNCSGEPSLEKTVFPDSYGADESPGSFTNVDEGDRGPYDECALEITPISMFRDVPDDSETDYGGPVGNDAIVYSPGDTDEMRPLHNVIISEDEVDREIVHGLMAAAHCPWTKGKTVGNPDGEMSGKKKRKQNAPLRKKVVAKKTTTKIQSSGVSSKKRNKVDIPNDEDVSPGALTLADEGDPGLDGDFPTNSPVNHRTQDFEVNLPPFGPKSSGHGDARDKVRETLQYFHTYYRKLLRQEEANSKAEEVGKSGQSGKKSNRIDLITVKFLRDGKKLVNTDKVIGPLPGVEVGDEFQYRVELAVVGIHFPYQSGIDSTKVNGVPLATSIVASGGYSDNLDDADVLIYSGQGGNVVGNQKAKQAEDQKLERGNLALKNCIEALTPVRVVRGWKESKYVDPLDSKPKMVTTYIYDGLYTVTRYWTEKGPRGKQVFKFELKRNPGQPELAWKELKKSNKFKTRPGTCVADISGGKEPIPICAVNVLGNEKPPSFNYVQKMMYPDWYCQKPPAGCNCTGRCSDSKKCLCAVRNGGEIPYNRNGALVETKSLVYECGPHCKCPPSCYNRVSQRGIKFKLEVFKTESRGWGVRPLTSIPSGSFICEYAGELLQDKEAEQRIGNDEYLFDIGQNVIDSSKHEEQEIAAEIVGGGFTIDACQYGNVGRFVNHSCSPNLHAQNVIFDHDDKRTPHIMLFAMENIPPLQELTYHYNYPVDQIRDSDGNIKFKKCCCGSAQCTGRLY